MFNTFDMVIIVGTFIAAVYCFIRTWQTDDNRYFMYMLVWLLMSSTIMQQASIQQLDIKIERFKAEVELAKFKESLE